MFDGKAAETVEMTGLSKNVQLQLASGKKYDVIFWAAADEVGAQSKFDETTQVATLAPTVCSNEADDAFFAKAEIDVNGNLQQTVKLYRPYAQLNIGTDDLAAAAASGYTVTKTQVATQAYSTINLAPGSVVGNATDVTFSYADIPDASEAFPAGSAYNYLSMNYVLVPDYKTIADVTLDYTNGTTPMKRTFTSVPLQRNYRTNIYGSLLTNSVDFNVVIEPAFIGTLGIATDEELANAASHHNRHVQLADNVQLAIPENIAEGVVITGGTNSVLTTPNGRLFPSQGVTFKDVTIARDDSNVVDVYDSDGCYMKITADNVVLDNVKFKVIHPDPAFEPKLGGGIFLAAPNLTVTLKNMTIPENDNHGVFSYSDNSTVILDNCEFGPNFLNCISFDDDVNNKVHPGKVIAKNTVFNGAVYGITDSYFESCKFAHSDRGAWYPVAECYGNVYFKNCEFGKYGHPIPDYNYNLGSPYDYDYGVSNNVAGTVIEFTGCRYSNGAAFDKSIFLRGLITPSKIIIDGTIYTDMTIFPWWG